MSWCKLEDTFHDDPKFRRLAELLGLEKKLGSERAAAMCRGFVASIWSWASRHAPDGYLLLDSCSPADVERVAGWPTAGGRLFDALCSAGFIDRPADVAPKAVILHRFWERAESHKAAIKKRNQRTRDPNNYNVSRDSPSHPAGTVPSRGEDREDRKDPEEREKRDDTMLGAKAGIIPPSQAVEVFNHWQERHAALRGSSPVMIPSPAGLSSAKKIIVLSGGDVALAKTVVGNFVASEHGYWRERNWALWLLTNPNSFEQARLENGATAINPDDPWGINSFGEQS